MRCEECGLHYTHTVSCSRGFTPGTRLGLDESTPTASPAAKRARHPESLLPPRAMPGAGVAAAFIALASAIAGDGSLPIYKRAAGVALLSVLAWAVGYFTPPPRRRFRRDD